MPGSAGGDPHGYTGGAVGGTGGNGGTGATHKEISIKKQTSYQIIIGGSAGSTLAFNESIDATGGGGKGAHADTTSIPSMSGANGNPGGSGILEFGEVGSDLYAGGGGSGATSSISKLLGGAGGTGIVIIRNHRE